MRGRIWTGIARAFYFTWLALTIDDALGQASQGVTRTELVVGSIQDLSGPMSIFGRQLRNGMGMRAQEINQAGGINGRRIRLVVEDSGNDPRRVALAVQKLISQDRVFAVLGQLGAEQNLAAMPAELEGNVINFLPVTGDRAMYEPPSPLKVAFWPSYVDQIKTGILYLAQRKKLQRPCIVFQDDAFGSEVLLGASDAVRQANLAPAEKIALKFAPGDTAVASQRLKAASCDLVVLGIGAREALPLVADVRRLGLAPDFVGTSALYSALEFVPGGHANDGLYAVHTVAHPYRDDASKLIRDWAAAYAKQFQEEPALLAVYGYYILDLFAKAAAKAGPSLTPETFEQVLEATTFPRDMFGSPEFHVTATDRLGSRKVRISELINGRWTPVTTLLDLQEAP